jgi:hypothetical protein
MENNWTLNHSPHKFNVTRATIHHFTGNDDILEAKMVDKKYIDKQHQ